MGEWKINLTLRVRPETRQEIDAFDWLQGLTSFEIDILAIKPTTNGIQCRHLEVQASFNAVSSSFILTIGPA